MDIVVTDPGVARGLEVALGHGSPFTTNELKALSGPLAIRGARDISVLRKCTALVELELFASDVRDLAALGALQKLSVLRIRCSMIGDLGVLASCPELQDLEVSFSTVEDLYPLLGLPSLRRGRLIGDPFMPQSYGDVRRRLLTTPVARHGRPPVIEFSTERDWTIARRLWDAGLRLCFGRIDGRRMVLVRPGIGSVPGHDCDFTRATPAEVQTFATQQWTPQALDTFFQEVRANDPSGAFDFASHRLIGDSQDAADWVAASSIDPAPQSALLRFVHRFPDLTFYRDDEDVLRQAERAHQASLPAWFRETRSTLAFIEPSEELRVMFDAFDDERSPRAENVGQIWYRLGLLGYADEEQRELLRDECDVFPIGDWPDESRSTLAIRLEGGEQIVHEFTEEDLWDKRFEGNPPTAPIRPAFSSYASMMAHIVAIRREDGTEIHPTDPSAAR